MGIVVRQSLKSAIITIIGIFLGVVATFFSLHYFSQLEYGFTNNLILLTAQASFLGLLGFNYAILIQGQRYPPDSESRGAFMTFCTVIPGISTLLIALAFYIFKGLLLSFYKPEDQEMMGRFFSLFPILAILTVANNWLSSYLQSIQKNAIQSFGIEIIYRCVYITTILCYAWGVLDYAGFIHAYLLSWVVPSIFFILIAKRSKGFVFAYKIKLPKKELREIFRFSVYHSVIIITTSLIFQISTIFVGTSLSKGGLVAAGVYSVAYFALSLLRNPTRVIATTAVPTFARHYLDGDLKGLKKLYHRSSVNMQILALGAISFIVLNAGFINHVINLVHEGYGDVIHLILILVLGQAADMICGFNYQIISISKYYRFNFWISLFLLVAVVVLSWILIPLYDVYGAAWATTIGLILFNIVKVSFVWSKFRMEPFTKKSIWVSLAAGISFAIAWLVPHTGFMYLDFCIKNLLLGGVLLFILLKFSISEEISGIVKNIIKKKRLF